MFEAEFKDDELKQTLKNVSKSLKYIKDGHKKFIGLMSVVVYRDIVDHFEKEEGSDGPWVKWSTYHEQIMVESGKGGNKILQDTGVLRNSFKPTNVKSTKEGIAWFNNAKTKNGFPYAFAHDEGGSQLPKRDFMWASDKALEDMANNMLAFIVDEGLE